nr:hypothetical protein [Tanacetum cinerariifolium]
MTDLAFAPQHNMIAYLEKTKGNAEFHQIVDFLTSSSIHHVFTVSPTIYSSNIEQFWNTANSQTINDEKQIHDTLDGKTVVITESSVRRDLLFTDDNWITSMAPSPAQPISESQIPESSSSHQNTQSPRQILEGTGFPHTRGPNFLDPIMDVEAVHKEGATLNEPNPQGEGSCSGLGYQETMGGAMAWIRREGAPIQSSDPPLSTGLGSYRMPLPLSFRSMVSAMVTYSSSNKVVVVGGVFGSAVLTSSLATLISGLAEECIQIREEEFEVTTKVQDIDDLVDEEVIVEDKGSGEKRGSTTETVSTARPDISVARLEVSTAEPKTPPTTTTLFDDEYVTIADTLVKMKSQKAKEKGVAFKDVDDSARPIRSITTLQPLLTIDLKDKDAFVPISSEEYEKRVGSRKKRAADDDKAINYETLDVKSLIVDCESQVLGTMKASDVHVYKLTRLDGSYKHFLTFSRMLEVLDRQDAFDLHKIVMERFPANDLEGHDLILWGDLKTLMESSEDNEI